jgi:hypothetical protein
MSREPHKAWPPLIIASAKPRWLVWRDFALTAAMWLLFAIMLETEFELFFGRFLERLGLGDFDTNPNWGRFFERLRPYVGLSIMSAVLLGGATVATLRRLRRFIKMAAPEPLQAADPGGARVARRGRSRRA